MKDYKKFEKFCREKLHKVGGDIIYKEDYEKYLKWKKKKKNIK